MGLADTADASGPIRREVRDPTANTGWRKDVCICDYTITYFTKVIKLTDHIPVQAIYFPVFYIIR